MGNVAWRLGTIAVLAPLAIFGVLLAFPSLDVLWMGFAAHFWIAGLVAVLAATACGVIVAAGRTLHETRLLFLALAFISVAGIFSVHGLMTRGYIADHYVASVGVSAWLSVLFGGIFAALSAVELPDGVARAVRRAGIVIFAWAVVGIGGFVAMSLTHESWLDSVPTDDKRIQYAIALSSFALYAFAALRYTQAYLFARLPSQAAMVIALALLMEVPPIILWGEPWHISWWIYHALYGMALAVLFAGWAVEVKRAGSLRAIADALSMRDALAQLDRGHDKHVLELVDAIEAKDIGTLGHVRRVGAYALAIGKRLNLSPRDLRSLVLAAEMHDVGKIGVPDAILGKPGPLTEEEFAIMRKHTSRGHDIAGRVRSLQALAPIIRAHHERLDGSGYPDHLKGEEIPLLARIIAVADTYDAMTSHRPYREPKTREAAIAELLRVRGGELDPRCVDALLASFEENPQLLAA